MFCDKMAFESHGIDMVWENQVKYFFNSNLLNMCLTHTQTNLQLGGIILLSGS